MNSKEALERLSRVEHIRLDNKVEPYIICIKRDLDKLEKLEQENKIQADAIHNSLKKISAYSSVNDWQKDRLEKLEKAFKIIWEELDLYMVALEKEYELCATWHSSNISKEKGKLLREVLEDEKD